jgi:DNA-binding NarL/FixJ family response regulator
MKRNSTEAASRSVLIVDDHPLLRQGLTRIIERKSDMVVCGEASDAEEALALAAEQNPDIAIVDISLRNSSGLELIKDMKMQHPHMPILVVSMHDESHYAERSLRAGAMGYVMKQETTTVILQAIQRILSGQIYLSNQMMAQIIQKHTTGQAKGDSLVEELSDRELEVFQLIGRGQDSQQIAEALELSLKTVEVYRARIKKKLALKNSLELHQRAYEWVREEATIQQI